MDYEPREEIERDSSTLPDSPSHFTEQTVPHLGSYPAPYAPPFSSMSGQSYPQVYQVPWNYFNFPYRGTYQPAYADTGYRQIPIPLPLPIPLPVPYPSPPYYPYPRPPYYPYPGSYYGPFVYRPPFWI
ncbi:hypothetical protein [Collibacillus ludicampi]|uniref:hypothetical protein n=1 Tax=Collibacillus ludicampi TaxID=2771369 RepID=UPI0024947B83|nr:hypothetical protein [Collibacillus ludicampi]